mgnify:CR=1 FL=1
MDKKFGAWDSLQKKFLWPWPEAFHIFGETTCFGLIEQQLAETPDYSDVPEYITHVQSPEPKRGTLERILEDIVIVQFIGLKDVNGKEAYSGAIFKDNKGVIRTIFEVPGGFATESNPISFGYGFQSNSNPTEALSDKQTASWFEGNCEIIGNIFENPELLNKKI